MPLPDRLLPHTATLIRPSTGVDRYGNTSYDYDHGARLEIRAWIEQTSRAEPATDGRAPLVDEWLMATNHPDVRGRDRMEWDGAVFEVQGKPTHVFTPAGRHHTEATLRHVAG